MEIIRGEIYIILNDLKTWNSIKNYCVYDVKNKFFTLELLHCMKELYEHTSLLENHKNNLLKHLELINNEIMKKRIMEVIKLIDTCINWMNNNYII